MVNRSWIAFHRICPPRFKRFCALTVPRCRLHQNYWGWMRRTIGWEWDWRNCNAAVEKLDDILGSVLGSFTNKYEDQADLCVVSHPLCGSRNLLAIPTPSSCREGAGEEKGLEKSRGWRWVCNVQSRLETVNCRSMMNGFYSRETAILLQQKRSLCNTHQSWPCVGTSAS
jgi:hypothetical protein